MEAIATWFAHTLGQHVSAQFVIFIVSMIPLLECRGGLIVASLLKVNIWQAIPICVIGNIIPIPFILLFIKRIFRWLKRFRWAKPWIEKLEKRAMNKSEGMDHGEWLGLLLFVGIPLPGTGAWTGTLAASILNLDFKKTVISIMAGVLVAGAIMLAFSLGLFKVIFGVG